MTVTKAQKKATAKYEKENYDKILTRFPKNTKEKIKETGASSVNNFIVTAVKNELEKYGIKLETSKEIKLPEETKSRIYKNITGENMPDWMRHEQEQIQVVQPEKSPDSGIFDGLVVSLERAKEIQDKLDQQFKEKEEQETQTPKRDSFADTLERYRKENSEGKLALNVREDI